ncbi:MAG: hypothetical protein ACJ76S_10130 [Solirubrobacteraceae bacterium]|jgi:hypothetical protein
MSTLTVVVVVAVAVVVLLAIGGAVANARRRPSRPELEASVEEANRALAAARAADKGWEPRALEAAARRAFEATRPGAEVRGQYLVAVLDRPGTDEDQAVFRFVTADGREARVTLGRSGGEWVARAIDG